MRDEEDGVADRAVDPKPPRCVEADDGGFRLLIGVARGEYTSDGGAECVPPRAR